MTEEAKPGWLGRLKAGLKRSSSKLTEGVAAILVKRKLDQEALEELEELLISSDLGVKTAASFTANLAKNRFNQDVSDKEIRTTLAEEITATLSPVAIPLQLGVHKPHIILMVGVNGSGKTTTIGKLAQTWNEQGLKVRMVAGDTFRAAAVEQLQKWGEKIGVPVDVGQPKADAAGLIYDACLRSQKAGDDVLLIDTAGRLQNKDHLMAELNKVYRVIQKFDSSAPHSCLLVLDATTGQNAHSQVEIFAQTVNLTGLIMTKLDGTARGGVIVSLAEKFSYPIHAIGVGEGANDLRPFDAESFAKNLLEL
ncbi:MAG: signal recognition particle-docking protein FtsY [Alphaproteobacteria bacterium]|nr:signal recognition particle-docking protein FtsY [Alphaproteobacteria bacterium]